MSNDNDRPNNTWDDENERQPPSTFRDAYRDAVNRGQPRPRAGGSPRDDMSETPGRRSRPRNTSGGGRIYEEGDERPSRPRPTRQSRAEVEARLRPRPRQSARSQDQDEEHIQPPGQARRPGQLPPRGRRDEQGDMYPYHQPSPAPIRMPPASRGARSTGPSRSGRRASRSYDEYEEYGEYEEMQGRRHGSGRHHRGERERRKSTLRTLFVGCVSSLLTLAVIAAILIFLVWRSNVGQNLGLGLGSSTYTQTSQQALNLGTASQLIVQNQAGDVAVNVDQNASGATLSSVKKVQASSSSSATSQFNQIKLTVKPISQGANPACTTGSCLLIATTLPATNGNALGSSNGNVVSLTITLPASFHSLNPATPYTISASTAAGNISVNGFTGILDLTGNVGNVNINVTHALIYAGTCLQTTHGNVVVNQESIFDLATPSKLVPCSATTSNQAHPWFNISSGVGNVSIALTTNSTNLLLDANTNSGKVTTEFGLTIPTTGDGSATYHGPLLPNTHPTASLYVATSTGNIAINKQ